MTTDKACVLKTIFVTPQPMRTALFVQPHYCALSTYHEGFDKFVDFDSYQSLKEENAQLQKRVYVFERARRIWERRNGDISDLMDASQEAQHYNWLDEQNQKLEEDNERLRKALQWALNGDTGLSSKHLVATHFNMDAVFYAPCDKGDRRRCIGAIRAIIGLENTLDIMKNKVGWAEQVPLIIDEMKG